MAEDAQPALQHAKLHDAALLRTLFSALLVASADPSLASTLGTLLVGTDV